MTATIYSLYEERARRQTDAQLAFALNDLIETLHIWRDRELGDPYVMKLYAEFDAVTTERHRRLKKRKA